MRNIELIEQLELALGQEKLAEILHELLATMRELVILAGTDSTDLIRRILAYWTLKDFGLANHNLDRLVPGDGPEDAGGFNLFLLIYRLTKRLDELTAFDEFNEDIATILALKFLTSLESIPVESWLGPLPVAGVPKWAINISTLLRFFEFVEFDSGLQDRFLEILKQGQPSIIARLYVLASEDMQISYQDIQLVLSWLSQAGPKFVKEADHMLELQPAPSLDKKSPSRRGTDIV